MKNVTNKILSLFLSLTMVTSMLPQMRLNVGAVVGDKFNVDDVTYEVTKEESGNEVKIIDYTNEASTYVVVPAEVTYKEKTYTVTAIEKFFSDGKVNALEEIRGMKNITTFAQGSLDNAKKLKTMRFTLNQALDNLDADLFDHVDSTEINVYSHGKVININQNSGSRKQVQSADHGSGNNIKITATCTKSGKHFCTTCGEGANNEIDNVPALGHSLEYKVNPDNKAMISLKCTRNGCNAAEATITLEDNNGQVVVTVNDTDNLEKRTKKDLENDIKFFEEEGQYTKNVRKEDLVDGKKYKATLQIIYGSSNPVTAELEFTYKKLAVNEWLAGEEFTIENSGRCSPKIIKGVSKFGNAELEYSMDGGATWSNVEPKDKNFYLVRCVVPADIVTEEEAAGDLGLVGRSYSRIESTRLDFILDKDNHIKQPNRMHPSEEETNILVAKCELCSKELERITLNKPKNLVADGSDEGREVIVDVKGEGVPEELATIVEYYDEKENILNKAPKEAGKYTAKLTLMIRGEQFLIPDTFIKYTIAGSNKWIEGPTAKYSCEDGLTTTAKAEKGEVKTTIIDKETNKIVEKKDIEIGKTYTVKFAVPAAEDGSYIGLETAIEFTAEHGYLDVLTSYADNGNSEFIVVCNRCRKPLANLKINLEEGPYSSEELKSDKFKPTLEGLETFNSALDAKLSEADIYYTYSTETGKLKLDELVERVNKGEAGVEVKCKANIDYDGKSIMTGFKVKRASEPSDPDDPDVPVDPDAPSDPDDPDVPVNPKKPTIPVDKKEVKTVTKTKTNFKTGEASNMTLLAALMALSLTLGLMVMRKRRLGK